MLLIKHNTAMVSCILSGHPQAWGQAFVVQKVKTRPGIFLFNWWQEVQFCQKQNYHTVDDTKCLSLCCSGKCIRTWSITADSQLHWRYHVVFAMTAHQPPATWYQWPAVTNVGWQCGADSFHYRFPVQFTTLRSQHSKTAYLQCNWHIYRAAQQLLIWLHHSDKHFMSSTRWRFCFWQNYTSCHW